MLAQSPSTFRTSTYTSFPQRRASTLLLDSVHENRDPASASDICTDLLFGLNLIRRVSPPEVWADEVDAIRQHPTFEHLLRFPVNGRAFEKPRGYAGDAVLIDLIYGIEPVDVDDRWVHAVHAWSKTMPSFTAVNARREAIARAVEQTVAAKPGASILSVACGHARELELVNPAGRANMGRFVCLDQDAESLATIARDYPSDRVDLVEGSVRDILRNKLAVDGNFDLIYTAGLYDYLEERVARALTAKLVAMLAPGGRLLIANFATSLPDIGYMEALMDWKLVYRTEVDMLGLAPDIAQKHTLVTNRTASPNLVWLDITLE